MSKPLFSGIPITAKDWMRFSFYDHYIPQYDAYYLRLANTLFEKIYHPQGNFRKVFKRDAIKELTIVLTRHFEDFINEIGIWEAVRKKNEHFYGKILPFYDLSEYDSEYLNPEDFSYLAWHTLSDNSKKVIDPLNIIMLELGQLCYDFFEERIDEALVNSFFDDWLNVDDNIPFFDLKRKLTRFSLSNYLTRPYFSQKLKTEFEDLDDDENPMSEIDPGLVAYMYQDQFALFTKSPWCALTGPEWFSEIAQCSDGLAKEIRHISKRVLGEFLYEGYDQKYYFYQFLKTQRHFKISRESIDLNISGMKPGKEIGVFTIVLWKGEWWLSGTYMSGDISAEKIEELKHSTDNPQFYGWTLDQQTMIRKMTEDMEAVFIHFFGGRLVIFSDSKMLEKGLNEFSAWWNIVKDDPQRINNTASPVFSEDVSIPTEFKLITGLPFLDKRVVLFYEPGIGYLVSEEILELIQLLQKDTLTTDEKLTLFTLVTMNSSPSLISELLIRYGQKNMQFPLGNDTSLLIDNMLVFHHFHNPGACGERIPFMSLNVT